MSTSHDPDGPAPSNASREPGQSRSGPSVRTIVIGVLLTLLLIAGAVLTAVLVNKSSPGTFVTASASKPQFPMELPAKIGSYSRDPNAGTTPETNPTSGISTMSATYSKGSQPAVVVVLSRPEKDAQQFMTEAAMGAVTAQDGGYCGTSSDNNLDACVVISEQTAVMAVGLLGQSRADLMAVAQQFGSELAG